MICKYFPPASCPPAACLPPLCTSSHPLKRLNESPLLLSEITPLPHHPAIACWFLFVCPRFIRQVMITYSIGKIPAQPPPLLHCILQFCLIDVQLLMSLYYLWFASRWLVDNHERKPVHRRTVERINWFLSI